MHFTTIYNGHTAYPDHKYVTGTAGVSHPRSFKIGFNFSWGDCFVKPAFRWLSVFFVGCLGGSHIGLGVYGLLRGASNTLLDYYHYILWPLSLLLILIIDCKFSSIHAYMHLILRKEKSNRMCGKSGSTSNITLTYTRLQLHIYMQPYTYIPTLTSPHLHSYTYTTHTVHTATYIHTHINIYMHHAHT